MEDIVTVLVGDDKLHCWGAVKKMDHLIDPVTCLNINILDHGFSSSHFLEYHYYMSRSNERNGQRAYVMYSTCRYSSAISGKLTRSYFKQQMKNKLETVIFHQSFGYTRFI